MVPVLLILLAVPMFLLTVHAAVNPFFFICQEEYLFQFLLDGGDTAGILAFDDIDDPLRKLQFLFFNDFLVLNDIYGNIMIDKT